MGIKRPHANRESSGHAFENPARKRLRTNRPHKPRPAAVDLDSINAIKKRARAIERLLARDGLKIPANKQNDLERELAAHKQRIDDAWMKKDRSKMIQKYHMVRFFERKKAMRFAKQLEKKVAEATDPEEVSQLKTDLHVAQVDIDYAKYFPFMEPYISLYAGVAAGEKDEKKTAAHYLRTPRPPMWSVVEKTREEGEAALERLQNRRPESVQKSGGAQPRAGNNRSTKQPSDKKEKREKNEKREEQEMMEKMGGSRRERRALARARASGTGQQGGKANGEDDESDGGFFEEN